MLRRVVIVDGARTPFLRSGTQFTDVKGYELLRHALVSVINKTGVPKDDIEYVVSGITLHPSGNSNIARDAAISAGFSLNKTPAHTVTMACISANQAITTAAGLISSGQIDCAIGCGVDSLSDPPIRVTKALRKWLLKFNKTKTNSQKFGMIIKLRPSMVFGYENMAVAEFTTDETMGEACDRVTAAFNVTRKEQDDFGLRSHDMAGKAQREGNLSDVIPMIVPKMGIVEKDNGIRVATPESVAKLKAAFTKKGTATAANSSFLTDGASATLLMSEEKALKLGLKPKAVIKDYYYSAIDPKMYLLLGPAHATSAILRKNKMSLKDIDVFEYHEAFSGQVLANLRAMDSDEYSKKEIGCDKMGMIPMEKLNSWGGSVSLGHPFGATGSRLVNMACNRLLKGNGQFALISACAGGALGHAMIIQRYDK